MKDLKFKIGQNFTKKNFLLFRPTDHPDLGEFIMTEAPTPWNHQGMADSASPAVPQAVRNENFQTIVSITVCWQICSLAGFLSYLLSN